MTGQDLGFAVIADVFDDAEVQRVLDALRSPAVDRTRAGARHVLGLRSVAALAGDTRMLAIAEDFIGGPATPFRATLFDKSPSANWLVTWHQDTALPLRRHVGDPEWGPWSTKSGVLYAHAPASALERVVALRVSLDDSTVTNGPLRVLPATHRDGVLTDAEIEQRARTITPVDCLAGAGGVVAMRPLAVHASSKSSDSRPRRVLHIEYATPLGEGVELAIA
jgi:ectoine hydroxylase-related dioxygenase (phytanoyl-CoA dioxygenase family)